MRRSNKEKTTDSKGFEPSVAQGLALCGGRGEQASSHLSRRLYKNCNMDRKKLIQIR